MASPPEVCQSFKEVLSTLRSVGDAHWARAVVSALGVCLAGIRPADSLSLPNLASDVLQVSPDRPDRVVPRVGQERRDSEDSGGRRVTADLREIPEVLDSPASSESPETEASPD